jgi:hypothetical protein
MLTSFPHIIKLVEGFFGGLLGAFSHIARPSNFERLLLPSKIWRPGLENIPRASKLARAYRIRKEVVSCWVEIMRKVTRSTKHYAITVRLYLTIETI